MEPTLFSPEQLPHIQRRPLPREIVAEVCRRRGLPYHEVVGRNRWPDLIEARLECALALREAFPQASCHRIGRFVGRSAWGVAYLLGRHKGATRPLVLERLARVRAEMLERKTGGPAYYVPPPPYPKRRRRRR